MQAKNYASNDKPARYFPLSLVESAIYDDFNKYLCDDFSMPSLEELFDIGDVIRKLRDRKGMTNEQLCAKSGINKSTLSKIENGKVNFTNDTAEKIAKGLGISQADIRAYTRSAGRPSEGAFCAEHAEICRMLEYVLHNGTPEKRDDQLSHAANWIAGNIVMFHAALSGPAPEGKYSPSNLPNRGDVVELASGKELTVGKRGKR